MPRVFSRFLAAGACSRTPAAHLTREGVKVCGVDSSLRCRACSATDVGRGDSREACLPPTHPLLCVRVQCRHPFCIPPRCGTDADARMASGPYCCFPCSCHCGGVPNSLTSPLMSLFAVCACPHVAIKIMLKTRRRSRCLVSCPRRCSQSYCGVMEVAGVAGRWKTCRRSCAAHSRSSIVGGILIMGMKIVGVVFGTCHRGEDEARHQVVV